MKNKPKTKRKSFNDYNTSVFYDDGVVLEYSSRNEEQDKLLSYLADNNIDIVVVTGDAGTGKTFLSIMYGLSELYKGKIKKLILSRPTIAVTGNEIGYLRGDLIEKMMAWIAPVIDNSSLVGLNQKRITKLIMDEKIEIVPISYIRGRSFNDSIIVVDECQNLTQSSMLSVLTRCGNNSKMIIAGDIKQTDLNSEDNGLNDLIQRMNKHNVSFMKHIHLTIVERSDVVKEILKLYKD